MVCWLYVVWPLPAMSIMVVPPLSILHISFYASAYGFLDIFCLYRLIKFSPTPTTCILFSGVGFLVTLPSIFLQSPLSFLIVLSLFSLILLFSLFYFSHTSLTYSNGAMLVLLLFSLF